MEGIKISEEQLHNQICEYIKLQYPKVLFNSDMAGFKLTKGQAKKASNLRSCNGFPDIMIDKGVLYGYGKIEIGNDVHTIPIFSFCGLRIEVKIETPFKKDGTLKSNKHIQNQNEILELLKKQGYFCSFVWNFEMAKKIIDWYLKL